MILPAKNHLIMSNYKKIKIIQPIAGLWFGSKMLRDLGTGKLNKGIKTTENELSDLLCRWDTAKGDAGREGDVGERGDLIIRAGIWATGKECPMPMLEPGMPFDSLKKNPAPPCQKSC